jgi:hypothetical protein
MTGEEFEINGAEEEEDDEEALELEGRCGGRDEVEANESAGADVMMGFPYIASIP